jgi:UDP-2,3-diacylglucosamine pyrophosphatase LpxH
MYQGDSVNEGFQAAMEDLFYKYGVDIYFSGHVHHYEV